MRSAKCRSLSDVRIGHEVEDGTCSANMMDSS